ncbi:odorant receptor 45a-like [Leptinotarsa decemlineata]|uniref:odorant receptor 45a-like n=1 Tax=Leptinotarsa decemlineata TaxID=7539 RepID=UPI003D3094F0
MLVVEGEYEKLLDSSVMFMIELTVIVKLLFLMTRGEKLCQIENFIRMMNSAKIPASILEYVREDTKKRGRMSICFRALIVMYLFIFGIMPFLGQGPKVLPVIIWAPYDLEKAIFFYPTFLGELVILAISAFSNSSSDLMYYILVDIACCQLDILKENLRGIDMNGNVDMVQKQLRMFVIDHELIIRFVKTIQSIYSNIIFIQCISSVLIICFQGFQLIAIIKFPSAKYSIDTVFILMMFYQIYWYCWFGQNIIIKSVEVGEACYLTNWYDSDLRVRKTISIIMERCKKPVKLTANLFTLDIAMLVSILRTSYSYMAILRTLYSE